jgi:hypothetical protein
MEIAASRGLVEYSVSFESLRRDWLAALRIPFFRIDQVDNLQVQSQVWLKVLRVTGIHYGKDDTLEPLRVIIYFPKGGGSSNVQMYR